MARSRFVGNLNPEALRNLRDRLYDAQRRKCFVCQKPINLQLHEGELEFDHIEPLAAGGTDEANNLALTHASCNRNKGASDLRIARCLAELNSLEQAAQDRGGRGATLEDLLLSRGGAKFPLNLQLNEDHVSFSFPHADDNRIHTTALFKDKLSSWQYFFAEIPIQFIHHDDVVNPRSIGSNVRGLLEEFLQKRPQLHVGLAWWTNGGECPRYLKLFDGQHKAAAQILLGSKKLPVRVFVDPPVNVLIQTNTNAGSSLRQVAFDKAVMRHLGSTQYRDRLHQYQEIHGLAEDDYAFSEQDLVQYFRGERRQMERFIIDAQRNAIARDRDNTLIEFVAWSGRIADRPMAYTTVERSFYQLLFQKALSTPIDQGADRLRERQQMVRLMSVFADTYLVGRWDPDLGGNKLENRVQKGEKIQPDHLRAWRICRAEVSVNVLRWVRLVIQNHNAATGKMVDEKQLFLEEFPDTLWKNIERFFINLSKLPCWTNLELSSSVFGPKQNNDYWDSVFRTGRSPTGAQILAEPLNLQDLISPDVATVSGPSKNLL